MTRVAAAAVGLALAGILLSLAGQRFGYPLLERWVGPGATVAGAVLWLGFRLGRGKKTR
ncbi:MAG: hypothetical protein SCH98_02015 [Deferrisomatales bacterium]|nr:hypothetical protein [Deferrisomatales bacterium]